MTRVFETNNTSMRHEGAERNVAYFALEATIIKAAMLPLDEESMYVDVSSDLIDGRICVVSQAGLREANKA